MTAWDLKNTKVEDRTLISMGPGSDIDFYIKEKLLLTMSEKGITFNHKEFPELKADDFVKEFIEILENSFYIKFIDKNIKK